MIVLIPGQNFLFLGTGREKTKCHGKGNLRLVFPGIMGNGNSRSSLIAAAVKGSKWRHCIYSMPIFLMEQLDFVNLNDQWSFLCKPKEEHKCCKHLRIQKAGHIFTYLQHWLSFELDVLHLTLSHNNHCSASEGLFICIFFCWNMNLRTKHGLQFWGLLKNCKLSHGQLDNWTCF